MKKTYENKILTSYMHANLNVQSKHNQTTPEISYSSGCRNIIIPNMT